MSAEKTFYAVDAHGFLHRAYHALPGFTTSRGLEVGAVFGFARFLVRLVKDIRPDYLAVCFDSPARTFRHEMYSAYKANRVKTDEALVKQLVFAREITAGLGLKVLACDGLEADDYMAWIARNARAAGARAVLVTTDKDICQLVSDGISVWTGGKEPLRGAEYVREKFGVAPGQMADYLAIVGDSSDNVPGVRGAGPKTAAALIAEFGTLDSILAAAQAGDTRIKPKIAQSLLDNRETALLSRRLVELNAPVPDSFVISEFAPAEPAAETLFELFKKYEFRDLAALARASSPQALLPVSSREQEIFALAARAGEVLLFTDSENILFGVTGEKFCVLPRAGLTAAQKGALFPVISNNAVLKIGWDIKSALHACGFCPAGGEIVHCFDLMLAAYCLNPSAPHLDFDSLAVENLGLMLPQAGGAGKLAVMAGHAFELCSEFSARLEKEGLWDLFVKTEIPLVSVLCRMEAAGIKVDTGILERAGQALSAVAAQSEAAIQAVSGHPVNINSPKQLAEFLFGELGINPGHKTKTGFSTDEEVLSRLAGEYPVAAEIIKYREAAKLKSVYVDGLLEAADAAGRVHTFFDQAGTATGRLSSSRPNLQNIPVRSEQGRLIRSAFAADDGKVFIAADYSQIDLRVLAHESGDPALCAAFESGGDIHTQTASEMFGVMPGMVDPEMRRRAKAINFGIVYGQGAAGLAKGLDIPVRQAREFIEHYFGVYAALREWIDETIRSAEETCAVRTLSGRLRRFPEIRSGGISAAAAQRAAVNTVIQGGSADVIKSAMLGIYPLLGRFGAEMLLQIHDELLFELPAEKAGSFIPVLRDMMEHAVKLRVPLAVTVKRGVNWQDMEAVK
ncbi:MAG: DNA polymerase I [Elusimicrobiaceae bacterium]|nr:DNA polymerase I [Elusimicrobiaceae bacterium]